MRIKDAIERGRKPLIVAPFVDTQLKQQKGLHQIQKKRIDSLEQSKLYLDKWDSFLSTPFISTTCLSSSNVHGAKMLSLRKHFNREYLNY